MIIEEIQTEKFLRKNDILLKKLENTYFFHIIEASTKQVPV
jgi:hypothetical protein